MKKLHEYRKTLFFVLIFSFSCSMNMIMNVNLNSEWCAFDSPNLFIISVRSFNLTFLRMKFDVLVNWFFLRTHRQLKKTVFVVVIKVY